MPWNPTNEPTNQESVQENDFEIQTDHPILVRKPDTTN